MSSTLQQAFALALQHHQAGRLSDAEAIYRQILAAQPQHADALHLLGVIAHQVGQDAHAVELIEQAIRLAPNAPVFHSNLGEALRKLGRLDEAIAAYRRALQLQPEYADAHNNLGNALRERGQLEEAIAACRQALRCRPDFAEAHNNLGNAFRDQGKWEDAIASYQQALTLHPNHAAIAVNLGSALRMAKRVDEAIAVFQRALQLQPRYAEAHNNLGNALKDQDCVDEAIDAYREALRLKPDYAEACCNLAVALGKLGEFDEAMALFRRTMELKPDDPGTHSNLVYTAHFHPAYDATSLSREYDDWEQRHGAPLRRSIPQHRNHPSPSQRLRIGYVSPDFYQQAECFFVIPLLEAHDHTDFEIHAYASVRRPDFITERLRRSVDRWHDVLGVGDEALAQQIQADEIDILIDLTMHMADNRLPLFARKPAPVQVTWLAYPGSTGLRAIDYRLTDAWMEPPGADDNWGSEKAVRLPDSWCCYSPVTETPDVGELPALRNGYVTFGSFNNCAKVNDAVLSRWARVLGAVADSRLVVLSPEGRTRQRVRDFFAAAGISSDRVELVAPCPRWEYLAQYRDIDLGLDPFPYNGITTTCDALWMGVPVLTLPGALPASRAGLSLLSVVGLGDFAAPSEDSYVQRAAELASDLPTLAQLRATLRHRLIASPLMDAPRFARNVEQAYREMWHAWCEQRQL